MLYKWTQYSTGHDQPNHFSTLFNERKGWLWNEIEKLIVKRGVLIWDLKGENGIWNNKKRNKLKRRWEMGNEGIEKMLTGEKLN